MASQPPQECFSAQHFALIYIDQYGIVHHEISPSIVHHRNTVLSPQVTADFLKAVANSAEVDPQSPSLEFASTLLFADLTVRPDFHDLGFQKNVKGHIVPTSNGYHEQLTLLPGDAMANSTILNDKLLHIKKSRTQKQSLEPQEAILSIKDTNFLRRYYEKVFQNVQQTNCRVLAKAYVKLVEPQKQVKYPYNGRKVVAGKILQLSPEESKPPWWPPEVRHREPDHLLKAERIALLLHILCDLHYSHGVTSQRLKDSEQSVRSQIIPVKRSELLDELYRVRGEEERFWEGFLDNNATVCISRINLPVADESSHKQDQPNSWVSLKYEQNSATYDSSSHTPGFYNAPPNYPQYNFAEYATCQESMIDSLPAPVMSFTALEKQHPMVQETCPSAAVLNTTELTFSHHVINHSLLVDFPAMEGVALGLQNAPISVHAE
ncbi:uncharacterized protein N7511_008371 [Penicillium nucicola]|uniref:uncharacterized protein n=1 Tax=Penicillium nucicola TaxID=1850975 RepID=UPI002544F56E|nr:uncharacterized protein N7511_008371 [Penicillium nucicola]KAJ5751406.1 hypothetical protein N7511_008371 [Penicillium nucicola]